MTVTDHDLTQADIRRAFEAQGNGPWTVVYDEIHADGINGGSYCALANPDHRKRVLGMDGWPVHKGNGAPGFMQSYEGGREVTTYLPRGEVDQGFELLILVREFHGVAEPILELDQQFRLFHNLVHIAASNTYVKMHDDGTQSPAAKLTGGRIEIRTPLLKQYISARQMDLLLFTDIRVNSSEKPNDPESKHFTSVTCAGRLDQFESRSPSSSSYGSRYCATKVIRPGPVETCGIWPYEDDDNNYPEFIIGEDEHGKPVKHTCNPELLANYIGANPDAPNYLTPVHFRRDVLAKYYNNPELYTVEDGYLRCVSLWGLQIDNDHDDRIVVFLGDLGRDLPSAERDHWRGYMISQSAAKRHTERVRGSDQVAGQTLERRPQREFDRAGASQPY